MSAPDAQKKPETPIEVALLLGAVDDGFCSVGRAAELLDWTMEDVQLAVWGEVVL